MRKMSATKRMLLAVFVRRKCWLVITRVDSNEDDPDNLNEIVTVCDMDDVADSVTCNNMVVDTATLTDNEDDLPEIDAGATNTYEVFVAPGPGSSNQIVVEDDLPEIDFLDVNNNDDLSLTNNSPT